MSCSAQNLTTLVRMFYCVVMWGANFVVLLIEPGPRLCVSIVNHVCINVGAQTERHLAQSWSKCSKRLEDGRCERCDRLTGNTSIGSSTRSGQPVLHGTGACPGQGVDGTSIPWADSTLASPVLFHIWTPESVTTVVHLDHLCLKARGTWMSATVALLFLLWFQFAFSFILGIFKK